MRRNPFVMTVPNVPSALDLHIWPGVIGVTVIVILGAFAITEGPQLHALDDAPVRVAEHSVIILKLIRALEIIVDVNAEYTQHVLVVAVPAIVDPVVEGPIRDF